MQGEAQEFAEFFNRRVNGEQEWHVSAKIKEQKSSDMMRSPIHTDRDSTEFQTEL